MQKTEIIPPVPCEVSERQLEAYLFGLMPAQISGNIYDPSVEMMEDHVLICHSCLEKAEHHVSIGMALKRSQQHQRKRSIAMVF